jgi:hypothetical protein
MSYKKLSFLSSLYLLPFASIIFPSLPRGPGLFLFYKKSFQFIILLFIFYHCNNILMLKLSLTYPKKAGFLYPCEKLPSFEPVF